MTLPKGWKPTEENTPIPLNEETIWRHDVKKGIIHRKVAETWLNTNLRVTQNNTVFNLSELDDIIVMNQHRSSVGTRLYVGTGARTAYGMGQSKGRTIGDVVFIYQGKPVIIFRQVSDPHGVARLAKTARKRIITAIQKANKIKERNIKERNIKIVKPIHKEQSQKNDNNFPIDKSTLINNIIMCRKCGYKNKSGSNFCNECGNNLQIQIANKQIANKQIADKQIANKQIADKQIEYQSPQYKFKINYPAKWQKNDKLPEGLMKVIFLSQSENITDQFLEGLAVAIEIFDYTLIQWIEASIDHMKNKYSDFVVIESLPTTLANLPAHQLVYTGGGIKQSLYVLQGLCVATKKGDSIYFIMYKAQKEKYLKFLPDVEQMISSFQFIE